MGRIVTEPTIALVDVVSVLGEAGAVEEFEGTRVGAGQRTPVDVDGRLVAGVGLIEGVERRGVGAVDLERVAGE